MTRLLFDGGPAGPEVEEFRARVRAAVSQTVLPYFQEAEKAGLFPREAYRRFAATGLVAERWDGPDPGRGAVIAEELGRAGVGGVAVGISLSMETVAAALRRYGGPAHETTLAGILDGSLVGCFGASEPSGGSDLNGMRTTAVRVDGGWRVRGEKKFLSLGRVADFALLLCRMDEEVPANGSIAPLGMVKVPCSDLRVVRPLSKVGTASLDTTWMSVDTVVPADAVVGRPGMGLAVAAWALSHERLAVAAQIAGVADRAIGLAAAHLHRREQFGTPLINHQALRLRLAELASELTVLRFAVYGAAASVPRGGCNVRESAALKVTAVRFAERVTSECMHLFGGPGYLEDETPMARMWRDVRLGRLGGGSDEMMWELVAAGLVPDFETYDREVDTGRRLV
ncbi:acyl-CoA dehydrogenase family protein [Actinocorallia sp. B10E7]|uniref:acyl-CoA dehydrogenase family protein n=1 Tax=Actinocorallia sp. B10E7 TaxID=3153558 RepID=UPI00325CA656